MEVLVFIFELLIGILDALVIGGDIHSWFKGRDNRVERREARRAGLPPPPRDRWNRRVILLSVVAVTLTTFLLIRHTR